MLKMTSCSANAVPMPKTVQSSGSLNDAMAQMKRINHQGAYFGQIRIWRSCDDANAAHEPHNKLISNDVFPPVKGGWVKTFALCFCRSLGGKMERRIGLSGRQEQQQDALEVEPLLIDFLRTLRELLKFVLFSYTVLFGALLLARWTTYFTVGKWW